jgi:4'-phosphopantetheinyl transferase
VVASRALASLGVAERFRWERILPAVARRDYLAAHHLRRLMLAERTGIDPAAFRFAKSASARPVIVHPARGLHYRASLSHADGIALCAVSDGLPVGADVESRRNLSGDLPAIAGMIAAPEECADLAASPGPEQVDRFLHLWTTHEAIAKAHGVGLGAPVARAAPRTADWQLACWRLTRDHVAAVIVRRPKAGRRVMLRIEGDAVAACA